MARARFTGLAVAAVLSACGGGGGDAPAQAPAEPVTISGLYFGTASGGRTFDTLILDSGRFYGFLGQASNGALTNVYMGSGTQRAGAFASDVGTDLTLNSGTIAPTTLSATGTPRTSITGGLTGGITYNATYSASFESAPDLSLTAGAYDGDARGPDGIGRLTMTVDASGALTGLTRGCNFTGTLGLVPGANVYTASFTFGAGCTNARGTYTGHALLTTVGGAPAPNRLTVIVTVSDFSRALFYSGTKP